MRLAVCAVVLLAAVPGARAQLLTVSPSTLVFGESNVGERVTKQVFVVSQLPTAQTVFVESSNQTFLPDPASIVPQPNELLPYNIIFLPRGAGPVSSVITFYRMVSGQREVLAVVNASGVGLSPFEVTPQEIDFGPLPVETRSEFRTIEIKALQTEAANLLVNVRSVDPESFEVTPRQITIPSNGSATAMVRFRPRKTGVSISTITFSTPGVTLSVVVRGSGVAFGVDPAELTLPATPTGCASSAPLTITPYDQLDFLIGSQGPPFVVTPSSLVGDKPAQVNVSVASVPAGVTEGTIVLNAREGGQITQQQLIPVQVAGVEVQASPESVDFGSIPPGGPPLERTVSIVSTLPGAAIDVGLQVASDNPAFVPTVDGNAIHVQFSPLTQGPVNGTLTVNATPVADPNCGRTLRIPVSGTGGNPLLTLTPPSVSFGEVGVGQTARISVSLTNRSSDTFAGTVGVDNNAFLLARADNLPNPQNVNIAPGQTINYNVEFAPTRPGSFRGEATFLMQATTGSRENAILTLPLQGAGSALMFTYGVFEGVNDPEPVNSGERIEAPPTAAGRSSLLGLRIRNVSDEPGVISSINILGSGFELGGTYSQIGIEPGGTFDAAFRFAPTRAGRAEATLAVGGAQFPLTGLGLVRGAQITGLPAVVDPAAQFDLGLTLQGLEPNGVDGELEVIVEPSSGQPVDPAVGFETGSNRAAFRVRAGTAIPLFGNSATRAGLQAGSVAGRLLVRAKFTSEGEDVTPPDGVEATAAIAPGPPGILSARVEQLNASGFTLVVTGYSPTRQASSAVIELEPRNGAQLPDPVIQVSGLGEAFAQHFGGSQQFGGLFELRAAVTLNGSSSDVAAAVVRVSNAAGESDSFRVALR